MDAGEAPEEGAGGQSFDGQEPAEAEGLAASPEAEAPREEAPEEQPAAEPRPGQGGFSLRHQAAPEAVAGAAEEEAKEPVRYVNGVKVGRNDPCPCGSGKKFKKCCGRGL